MCQALHTRYKMVSFRRHESYAHLPLCLRSIFDLAANYLAEKWGICIISSVKREKRGTILKKPSQVCSTRGMNYFFVWWTVQFKRELYRWAHTLLHVNSFAAALVTHRLIYTPFIIQYMCTLFWNCITWKERLQANLLTTLIHYKQNRKYIKAIQLDDIFLIYNHQIIHRESDFMSIYFLVQ